MNKIFSIYLITICVILLLIPLVFACKQSTYKIAFLSGDPKKGICLIRDNTEEISLVIPDTAQGILTIDSYFLIGSPDGNKVAFIYDRMIKLQGQPPDIVFRMAVASTDGSGYVDIESNIDNTFMTPTWSPDSKKLAVTSNRDGNHEIYTVNADGTNATNLTNNPADDSWPAWSPNGDKIAFVSTRDGLGIYLMNIDGSGVTRLLDHIESVWTYFDLQWSPDGKNISFLSRRQNDIVLNIKNVNDNSLFEIATTPIGSGGDLHVSWAPNSLKIVYTLTMGTRPNVQSEIFVADSDGKNITNITNSSEHELNPTWSPDGTRIAFTRIEDYRIDIYIAKADGSMPINITNSNDENHDAGGFLLVWLK